jgi:polar amino acid transport system substrate-binding protein
MNQRLRIDGDSMACGVRGVSRGRADSQWVGLKKESAMKVNRIEGCAWLSIGILAMLAGCSATPASERQAMEASSREELPTLRVGTSPTVPPIIFEQDGEMVGLEADLARELAAALGMEARLVSMYWPKLVRELRTRRIDIIMAGMSITDERKRDVRFTDPYLTTGQAALIRAEDRSSLGTLRQVLATRGSVGVEGDSTGHRYVAANMPASARRSFPTILQATEALILGDVDVVIHDQPTILWLAREHAEDDLLVVPGRLTEESFAWAVRRDNESLRDEINAILAEWKESGHLEAILARWVSPLEVDADEKAAP